MPVDQARLHRALNPRTLVVVGDKGPNFSWLTNNEHFTGDLYSVQVDEKEIEEIEKRGFTNFTRLEDVPGDVDLLISAVPRNVLPYIVHDAVEKGVAEAMEGGVLGGYPLTDVKVNLYDGKQHPVDSSEMAFKIAGSVALKQGVKDANPVLLEPIMRVSVTVPESHTGDVLSDLNGKRGKVQGMTPQGALTVIEAQVPLAEVQRYATDLRSITQGRAHYTMEMSHYEEVPAHIAQKVIESGESEAT